ncbi:hypothetical protein NC651_010500 [Populus alba x Populus x berolinensis]|nr:hypothetical protein NC651_010500 [Populus alba x Populus x berolinensis]
MNNSAILLWQTCMAFGHQLWTAKGELPCHSTTLPLLSHNASANFSLCSVKNSKSYIYIYIYIFLISIYIYLGKSTCLYYCS